MLEPQTLKVPILKSYLMEDTESKTKSRIDLKRIFSLLFYSLIGVVGIMVLSLLILFVIQGREHKGLFYFLIVIAFVIPIFWLYLKDVHKPSKLPQEPEPELIGNLESMAKMIKRASRNLEYSREKLDERVSKILGREVTLEGTGAHYIKALEAALKEV